jgi:hypothetical protein
MSSKIHSPLPVRNGVPEPSLESASAVETPDGPFAVFEPAMQRTQNEREVRVSNSGQALIQSREGGRRAR